jgi:mono/diheme cytochrome c family protein
MRHLALLSLLVSASAFAADAPKANADREKAWKADIFPMLENSCAGCHGKDPAKKAKGGFNIMTLESAAKGGKENAPGITWGNVAKSPIYTFSELGATNRDDEMAMPPKKAKSEPLTKAQLAKLKAFIEAK